MSYRARWTRWLALGLFLGVASVGAATEIDIAGDWQVNLDCSAYATATNAFSFSEDVSTGVVTTQPTGTCGTVAFSGEAIATIATCTTTPNPTVGQVSGASFALPSSGVATTDQDLLNPLFWDVFGCTVTGTNISNTWSGTIQDDGFGIGTRITGSLTADDVTLKGCGFFGGPYTFCSFEMLRSTVPVGSNVTVTPSPDVSVTFATVTAPGVASVTELNDPDGEIPTGFQLLGGVLPIFYDVATTATISGAITSCVDYADANGDGIVDGTNIDENDLQLLHEEDGVFVDRTASIDTGANVICADTTSLSQLVPGASTAPPDPGGSNGGAFIDVKVSGIKFVAKRKTNGKEKLAYVTRDKFTILPPELGSDNDPTLVGATFEVVSDAEGLATFDLPASGWFTTNSGVFKFAGKLVPGGSDVKKAVVKPGRAIVVKTTATALPLAGPHTAMAVRLTTGAIRHCTRFGPTTIVKDEVDRFSAKGALAGALLDCSNAAIGASPSGAFLDAPLP